MGPRAPWLFAASMALATAVALFGGLILGILAALETGYGHDRWTPAVQAHGRLQLFGFAAAFTVAVALEFLPRLYQRPMFPPAARAGLPALLVVGSVLTASGELWSGSLEWLMLPGALLVLAGALGFAVAVLRAKPVAPLSVEPQPLFFRAGAAWLVVASAIAAWSAARADWLIPLDESWTAVELVIRGLLLNVILAVALRAFVGHLGLRPMSAGRQAIVVATLNASVLLWLLGQDIGPLPGVEALARIGDAGAGAAALLFTVWLGVLTPLRDGFTGPRYRYLIPIAWLGLVAWSAALILIAVLPGGYDLGIYQAGGVRHIFMLGFMVPLMIGMAHVVLARFGVGTLLWPNALLAAFVLAMVSWPLRVLPVLFTDGPSDLGHSLMGIAGVLAIAALALMASVALRTALAVRQAVARSQRAHAHGHVHPA
jgi:hypothetical protein